MKRRTFIKIAAGGIVGLAGALPADAVFLEPTWFETTRHTVTMTDFPAGHTIKIAQMSDFHRGPYIGEEHIRKAADICNGLKADVIVLTGDFVSRSPDFAQSCARALSGLSAPMGVFAVLGNHDHWEGADKVVKQLVKNGVEMLTNKNVRLMKGVRLIGIDDYWVGNPDIPKSFKGVPDAAAQIVITHSPLMMKKINERPVVMIVGHTHGGQANIPFIPRNELPGLRGWKYIRGWYKENKASMYVNRGIGMVTPPIRFRCRPEITFFEFTA